MKRRNQLNLRRLNQRSPLPALIHPKHRLTTRRKKLRSSLSKNLLLSLLLRLLKILLLKILLLKILLLKSLLMSQSKRSSKNQRQHLMSKQRKKESLLLSLLLRLLTNL